MTIIEAKETIRDITADVLESRGDMGLDQVRKWAPAYTHWREACDTLTTEAVDDAMYYGLRLYQQAAEL